MRTRLAREALFSISARIAAGRPVDLSQAMSQENLEFAKALFAAGSDMDKEALLSALPDLIAQTAIPRSSGTRTPSGPMPVSVAVTVACANRLSDGSTIGTSLRHRGERFVDCGDEVLVVAREHGRGARSGATVSGRIILVITFRDGKLLRYREFYDEAAALEAAGLS